MRSIFDIVFGLLIITLAFSFACIRSYLTKRKIIEFKMAYFNPYAFLSSYINATKHEKGKIGIWFWLFIISFFCVLFLGLVELIWGLYQTLMVS